MLDMNSIFSSIRKCKYILDDDLISIDKIVSNGPSNKGRTVKSVWISFFSLNVTRSFSKNRQTVGRSCIDAFIASKLLLGAIIPIRL